MIVVLLAVRVPVVAEAHLRPLLALPPELLAVPVPAALPVPAARVSLGAVEAGALLPPLVAPRLLPAPAVRTGLAAQAQPRVALVLGAEDVPLLHRVAVLVHTSVDAAVSIGAVLARHVSDV